MTRVEDEIQILELVDKRVQLSGWVVNSEGHVDDRAVVCRVVIHDGRDDVDVLDIHVIMLP